MNSHKKITAIISSLLLSVIILRLSDVNQNLSEFALGDNTSTYFAKDINDNIIHISNIDSISVSEIQKIFLNNNKKDVLFILGNSQTHSINQMNNGEVNYVELISNEIENKQIISNTFPNASFQDFYISYMFWKDKLNIESIFIPLFFDDTRENNGISHGFFKYLSESKFEIASETELARELNAEILLKSESVEEKTTQEKSEEFLNTFLEKTIPDIWPKRKIVQGEIYGFLYLLRNRLFNIKPTSIRKKINEKYDKNINALEELISDATKSKIKIHLYIPPIRNDVKIPYDIDDYFEFINYMKNKKNKYVKFINYSEIVPPEYFGYKESTSLGETKKEYDFMHFQYEGHKILSDSLMKFYFSK